MRFRKYSVSNSLLMCALCAAFCLSPKIQAQTWTHPGIVVSQAQLDATRAAYQAGNSVMVDQVNKAMNSNYGSLSYAVQGPWPGGINQCGANSNPNNGCLMADNDSNAAYVQALLWYMTGNQTYANNAINIMNTYARNFRGYAGTNGLSCPSGTDCSNGPLQSGWDSEKWPRAAEIIRLRQDGQRRGLGLGILGHYRFQQHAEKHLPAGNSERLGRERQLGHVDDRRHDADCGVHREFDPLGERAKLLAGTRS